jgi:hypothetical protein
MAALANLSQKVTLILITVAMSRIFKSWLFLNPHLNSAFAIKTWI